MKSSLVPLAVLALCVSLASPAAAAEGENSETIRILLTTGGHGFQEEPFYAMFDAMEGIEYTKAQLPQDADLLKPGLEKKYDCLVMYDMCKPGISPEQQQAFVKLVKDCGIGVVSMHHNLGAHWTWDEFRRMIGGRFILKDTKIDGQSWKKTPWSHGERLEIKIADKQHPITEGVDEFEIEDETYGEFWVDPEAHILLTTDHPKNNREIAWTKEYGKSRVFHLMLGHDGKAYANPSYRRLLEQGIRWAAAK